MSTPVEDLLKKHNLRKTPVRIATLEVLLSTDRALAHSDIEDVINGNTDRVTLYRTLATFEEKGIIHRAYDGSDAVKYALCHSSCSEHDHKDDHLHFNCSICGNTYCLEGYSIPVVESPVDFEIQHVYLFAKGICKTCK